MLGFVENIGHKYDFQEGGWSLQGQIQDLVKGGPKFFMPIFADSVQQSHVNKVSPYWPGPKAHLRTPEVLVVFITKYAFSPFWVPFYTIFEIIK